MTNQLDIFSGDPAIEWLEVTRLPAMSALLEHCGKAFSIMAFLEDWEVLKTWECVNVAHYCARHNVKPRGYDVSQYRLLPQLGGLDLIEKEKNELKQRGLEVQSSIDKGVHFIN